VVGSAERSAEASGLNRARPDSTTAPVWARAVPELLLALVSTEMPGALVELEALVVGRRGQSGFPKDRGGRCCRRSRS
jgi:hypothetical protein